MKLRNTQPSQPRATRESESDEEEYVILNESEVARMKILSGVVRDDEKSAMKKS